MVLILEVAAGVCLGLLAFVALWVLPTIIARWYKEQRWWLASRTHERMVRDLSRRYSRHLLEEAGRNLPWWADALKTYVAVDGGEGKFDPDAMAKIQKFGRHLDAMR
jgi:hypothetical protein